MSNRVPTGWSTAELGGFCEGIQGVTYKPDDLSSSKTGSTVTLLRSNNIKDGSLNFIAVQHVNETKVKKRQIAKAGDIAVCMSNGSKRLVGKSATFNYVSKGHRYTVGAFCSIFRPHDSVCSGFVAQLFNSDQFQKQVDFSLAGSAINNLKNSDLVSYQFLEPPLPEQQKIATILSSVDDVIEKIRAQIDKLKDLKTGMMQELLTKGIGHTEFKDSPVGRIPASWDFVTIADCTTRFYQGINTVADNVIYQHQGVQIIQAKHITSGKLNFNDARYISNDDYYRYKNKFQPCIDDVLFSNIGTIGKSVIVHEEYSFLIAWNVFLMRVEKHVQPKFMHYFLQYLDWMNFYDDLMTGNATKFVNKSSLGSVVIPVPSKKEQTQIISAIDSIDKRLEVMTNKLGAVLSIKKALMQDLLTGKVRVKLTDKESAVS